MSWEGGEIKSVSALNKKLETELEALHENGANHKIRIRAHSILSSARDYTIEEIAGIYDVHRDTVSSWSDRWMQSGINGLSDKPSGGRPPILTVEERCEVLELTHF